MILSCTKPNKQIHFSDGEAFNPHHKEAVISLDSLGLDYITLEDLIYDIEASTFDSLFALKTWDYLCRHTYHEEPLTTHQSMSNPELLINSVRFGFCDDVSQLMARLCSHYGLPARLICLGGHTVVEVKEQGKWMVLDVDQRNYLLAEDGRPASYQEIIEEDIVKQVRHPDVLKPRNLLDLVKIDSVNLTYSLKYYQSEHNNTIRPIFSLDPKPIPNKVILPSNTKVEFTHLNNIQPVRSFVKVNLYPEASGKLYFPLVPMGVTRPINLKTPLERLDKNIHLFTYSDITPDTFTIQNSTKDTISIFFLANGLSLNGNQAKTTLSDNDSLVKAWCNYNTKFGLLGTISDTLSPEHLDFVCASKNHLSNTLCISSDEELVIAYTALMQRYNNKIKVENVKKTILRVAAFMKKEKGDDFYRSECNGPLILSSFIIAAYLL